MIPPFCKTNVIQCHHSFSHHYLSPFIACIIMLPGNMRYTDAQVQVQWRIGMASITITSTLLSDLITLSNIHVHVEQYSRIHIFCLTVLKMNQYQLVFPTMIYNQIQNLTTVNIHDCYHLWFNNNKHFHSHITFMHKLYIECIYRSNQEMHKYTLIDCIHQSRKHKNTHWLYF